MFIIWSCHILPAGGGAPIFRSSVFFRAIPTGEGGDTQTCRVLVWIYLWQATFSSLTTLMSEESGHNFGNQTRVTSRVSFFGYLWFHSYSKENYGLWKRAITMNKGMHLNLLLSSWHIPFLDTIPRHCVEKSELLNKVVRLFHLNSRSLENLFAVLSKAKHFLSLPSFSLSPLFPPSLPGVGGLVHARQPPTTELYLQSSWRRQSHYVAQVSLKLDM